MYLLITNPKNFTVFICDHMCSSVCKVTRSPLLFSFHPNVLQDDDDGHLLALQIIRDLVDKGGDLFLDQLARLGVISKVSTLAGPSSDDENEEESKPEKVSAWN